MRIWLQLLIAMRARDAPLRTAQARCFGGQIPMDWEHTYRSCCWHCDPECFPGYPRAEDSGAFNTTTTVVARCVECCCSEVNYTSLRISLMTYSPTLMYTDVARVMNAMPEVYVASEYMWKFCFREGRGRSNQWLSAPDPLGVLALRLFYLVGMVEEDPNMSPSMRSDIARGLEFKLGDRYDDPGDLSSISRTLFHLSVALMMPALSARVFSGQWPVFLLAWVLSRRLPMSLVDSATYFQERVRLQHDEGLYGRIFRSLWGYLNVSTSSEQLIAAHTYDSELLQVARSIRILHAMEDSAPQLLHSVAEVAVALVMRDWGGSSERDLNVAGPGESSSIAELINAAVCLKDILFHVLPLCQLLDRMSLEPTVPVEDGLLLYLPTVRSQIPDVDGFQAAKIRATKSACCPDELDEILATGYVSHVVDVGAQFGACISVAARRFQEIRFWAMDMVEANIAFLRRTIEANGLRNVRASAVKLTSSLEYCNMQVPCNREDQQLVRASPYACACSTLDAELGNSSWRESTGDVKHGTLLWLGQLQPGLDEILEGGRKVLGRANPHGGAVDIVGVVTTLPNLPQVRRHLEPGYWLTEKLGEYSSVFILATRRQ